MVQTDNFLIIEQKIEKKLHEIHTDKLAKLQTNKE